MQDNTISEDNQATSKSRGRQFKERQPSNHCANTIKTNSLYEWVNLCIPLAQTKSLCHSVTSIRVYLGQPARPYPCVCFSNRALTRLGKLQVEVVHCKTTNPLSFIIVTNIDSKLIKTAHQTVVAPVSIKLARMQRAWSHCW